MAKELDSNKNIQIKLEPTTKETEVFLSACYSTKDSGGAVLDRAIILQGDGEKSWSVDHVFDFELARLLFYKNECFALGVSGEIYKRKANSWELIQGDSGLRLSFTDGVYVEDKIYACTYSGQILVHSLKKNKKWDVLLDLEEEDDDELSIHRIVHDSKNSCIYACGEDGFFATSKNGKNFDRIDLGTSKYLTGIKEIGPGRFLCYGKKGTSFVGSTSTWKKLDLNTEENFFDVLTFGKSVYLTTGKSILELDSKTLKLVKTIDSPAYQLTEWGDKLVASGMRYLESFDGKKWTKIHIKAEGSLYFGEGGKKKAVPKK